jgi:hypothetical protein
VAKPKLSPKVVKRTADKGRICSYDAGGRPCFDLNNPERIVLKNDFREYAPQLSPGALGWTVPSDCDGYTFARVAFDAGPKFRVRSYALERVSIEAAEAVAKELLAENRNTRFDADPLVAAKFYQTFLKSYSNALSLESTVFDGAGDQQVYAFSFPSLIENAALKKESVFPVKIGFTKNGYGGALERIRSFITEHAGYPEKPIVLVIFKCWEGRSVESQVHRCLREMNRKCESLGREWFRTSTPELLKLLADCEPTRLPEDRILVGNDETIAEGFANLMQNGAVIEMGMDTNQCRAFIKIRRPGVEPDRLKGT